MIGGFIFGGFVFDDPFVINNLIDVHHSPGRMRAHVGFKQFGRRQFSRSESYELKQRNVVNGAFATINITSASGALIGKIRTDVEHSIVISLQFVLDEHGCADFTLRLNKLPAFDLLPFSILSIAIGDTVFNWYSGEISYTDDLGTQREFYEFKGFGLRNYLKGLKAFTTYSVGTDIADVVKDIVQTWIVPYCKIKYNPSKIESSTGVILANDIELGKYTIDKILDTLGNMANARWGVDGDNDLYFEIITDDLVKTFFIGYRISEFKPKLNLTEIKNAIIIQRQQGLGSGGAGWEVGGIFNDVTSVKKYGRKELTFQVPGFFSDDDCNIVGNNLLAEKKEPKLSAEANGIRLLNGDDYLFRGVHRFILPLEIFSEIVNDLDDESEFSVIEETGQDLEVTKETGFFVHGDGCIKLEYSDAFNARAELDIIINRRIQKIRFFIRSNKTGQIATVGVGLTNWDENTTKISCPVADLFYQFDWDVSALELRKLRKFAIRIDEQSTDQTQIYIDRLSIEIQGHKTYRLLLNRAKYQISTKDQSIDAEFGVLPPRMENYIAGLFQSADELKFTQEIRST